MQYREIKRRAQGSEVRRSREWALELDFLSVNSYVTWGKLLEVSVLQFSHL